MKLTNHPFGLLCFCLALPFFGSSQTSEESYYKWFDAIVSVQNAGLYSGIEYIDTDRATEEAHKFFLTPKFVKGDVVHQDQKYYNVDVKLNVFDDVLVVKLPNQSSELVLAPIKEFISGFTIGAHEFVNIQDANAASFKISGFYEILQENDQFTFLKKHTKNRVTRLDSERSYFEFNDSNPNYFLAYNNAYYSIRNKRDVAKLFPSFKKEINDVLENRARNKSDEGANDTYLKNLLQRVAVLLSNSNKAE